MRFYEIIGAGKFMKLFDNKCLYIIKRYFAKLTKDYVWCVRSVI